MSEGARLRMDQPMFELVFEGQIVEGQAIATVQANMAKLFKASEDQMAKMFGGNRVVLKNKLDKATALKYQAVLKKNGAIVKIALMSAGASTAPASGTTPTPMAQNRSPQPASPQAAPAQPTSSQPEPAKTTTSPGRATFALPDDEPSPSAGQSSRPVASAPSQSSSPAQTPTSSAASETGRLNVGGEKVDEILAGKPMDIAPVGAQIGEHQEVEAPVFEHLEDITIAPAGSDLLESEALPPPPAPDVSHISIAPVGSDMGQLKKDEKVTVPDISHIKLEK